MKHFVTSAAILIATMTIACADQLGVRSCDFDIKQRCTSGSARVTLANGVVKRVEVEVFSCGLPGHPGYTCTIDSSRGDDDSLWSQDGDATLIANTAPWNPRAPDRLKVTPGRDVSIDLSETQSLGRCGVGAELPRAIVLPAKKGACKVTLR